MTVHHLIYEVFVAGGDIFFDNGALKVRNCTTELINRLRTHKQVITGLLRSIYELAPEISPELIAAIWIYSFRDEVLSSEQNKWENVLFLAELARNHPMVIMRHCIEPPSYKANMN